MGIGLGKLGSLGIGSMTMFMAIIAYLQYDSIRASLAIIAIMMISGLVYLLSLIPFIGHHFQEYLMTNWIFPKIMGIAGIEETWLTTVIFKGYDWLGIGTTFVTSALTIIIICAFVYIFKDYR